MCYLETAFPAEYRGSLFFCEWGRSVVRYQPRRAGAGFTPLKEVEFAAGAANDPYGFKPTDLVVDRDGSLLVADWADGQQPRRGRGRIYRIAHTGKADRSAKPGPKGDGIRQWIARLDSASYHERNRAQVAIEHRGREGMAALFREVVTSEWHRPRWRYLVLIAAVVALLIAVVIGLAYDKRVATVFVMSSVAVFVLLRGNC